MTRRLIPAAAYGLLFNLTHSSAADPLHPGLQDWVLGFKNLTSNLKSPISVFYFCCVILIYKRYTGIQILIAICEIHQFHLHFSVFTWCFHPSLTEDLSLVRYVWRVFHVLLGRTFVFGLRTKKTQKPKNTF